MITRTWAGNSASTSAWVFELLVQCLLCEASYLQEFARLCWMGIDKPTFSDYNNEEEWTMHEALSSALTHTHKLEREDLRIPYPL